MYHQLSPGPLLCPPHLLYPPPQPSAIPPPQLLPSDIYDVNGVKFRAISGLLV